MEEGGPCAYLRITLLLVRFETMTDGIDSQTSGERGAALLAPVVLLLGCLKSDETFVSRHDVRVMYGDWGPPWHDGYIALDTLLLLRIMLLYDGTHDVIEGEWEICRMQ